MVVLGAVIDPEQREMAERPGQEADFRLIVHRQRTRAGINSEGAAIQRLAVSLQLSGAIERFQIGVDIEEAQVLP